MRYVEFLVPSHCVISMCGSLSLGVCRHPVSQSREARAEYGTLLDDKRAGKTDKTLKT